MSPIERHVTEAIGKAQPGAAVDFATIMALITQIFTFIQQCPFGRAKAAMREGSVEAKTAAYLAVKRSGYGGNSVDLAHALLEQGRSATDAELDDTIASALSLPGLTRIAGVFALVVGLCTSAAAGPFPTLDASSAQGPFPAQAVSAPVIRLESAQTLADVSESDASGQGEVIEVQPPLRQRIDDYLAAGGGIVGVRDMTITTHMLRDHGWTAEQLAGLTEDELFALHGMQHAGLVEPTDVATADRDVERRGAGYPVQIAGDWAYWSVDGIRWSNLGQGRPAEGQLYLGGGRRFVYREGRMQDAAGN